MLISKEEWLQWKDNIVTKGFFAAMQQRIEECKDLLSVSAGINSDDDNFNRGFIAAYVEALDFRLSDMEEDS